MLANITRLSLKNLSTRDRTFAERFFSCEINFCGRLFGFSLLFRFRLALLDLKTNIFLVVQHEKCFERPAFAGNEPLEQIRFAAREQFIHLFSLDWPLQNDFARSEVAGFVWAD